MADSFVFYRGTDTSLIITVTCEQPLSGTYVTIQLNSHNYLQLSDVEIVADPGNGKELTVYK